MLNQRDQSVLCTHQKRMIQTQQQKKDQNHSTLSETVVVMQQSALSLSWTQDAARAAQTLWGYREIAWLYSRGVFPSGLAQEKKSLSPK